MTLVHIKYFISHVARILIVLFDVQKSTI